MNTDFTDLHEFAVAYDIFASFELLSPIVGHGNNAIKPNCLIKAQFGPTYFACPIIVIKVDFTKVVCDTDKPDSLLRRG